MDCPKCLGAPRVAGSEAVDTGTALDPAQDATEFRELQKDRPFLDRLLRPPMPPPAQLGLPQPQRCKR